MCENVWERVKIRYYNYAHLTPSPRIARFPPLSHYIRSYAKTTRIE